MSYTITKTDGTTLGTILDGTINTSFTSLTLIGRNYANYGQLIANNLVKLVENFAYSSEPSNPLAGQLWWNTSDKRLRVATADGGPFKVISSATVAASEPAGSIAGDLWFDTNYNQLYVYGGSAFILIGPQRNNSGAVWEEITDNLPSPGVHQVLSIKLNNARTSIISRDSEFTPAVAIPGYTTIKAGINANTSIGTGTFWGTANNSSYLGAQPAANYFRNNTNNSGTGTLSIVNNSGLTVGAFGQFVANITSNNVSLHNTVNGSLNLVNQGNVALTVTAAGQITVNTDPAVALGVATKQYVDNSFINANLWGVSTAVTAPMGTANTMIATTEFVVNNSGLYQYKIYSGSTHMWVDSSSANIVISGTTVATASASGFNLFNGATSITQTIVTPTAYHQYFANTSAVGNSRIATGEYVSKATQYWSGSAKFVSTAAPDNSVGKDGDFWFQREA